MKLPKLVPHNVLSPLNKTNCHLGDTQRMINSSFDVKIAFLNGELKEEMYMSQLNAKEREETR